jgi:mycothiol synthase
MINQPPTGKFRLTWRSLDDADMPALVALMAAGLDTDGGLPLATDQGFLKGQYLPDAPRATIGGFDADDTLAAAASVRATTAQQEPSVTLVGMVHPSYRQRGIGRFLMDWSFEQPRALLAGAPPDVSHVIWLRSESFSEQAARLYARYGLTLDFAEDVMRRDLQEPIPEAPLPGDIMLAEWRSELAEQFFVAYDASFRDRPGFPGWSAEQWIEGVVEDDDFRADMSLLAIAGGTPIGFIVCAADWIVQVGTRPEWRGRGLASALICEVMRRMRASGEQHTTLTVNVNNPGATRVYEQLGFTRIGRRARFIKG